MSEANLINLKQFNDLYASKFCEATLNRILENQFPKLGSAVKTCSNIFAAYILLINFQREGSDDE